MNSDINTTAVNIDSLLSKKKFLKSNGSSVVSGRINPVSSKEEMGYVSGGEMSGGTEYRASSGGTSYAKAYVEWRLSV